MVKITLEVENIWLSSDDASPPPPGFSKACNSYKRVRVRARVRVRVRVRVSTNPTLILTL